MNSFPLFSGKFASTISLRPKLRWHWYHWHVEVPHQQLPMVAWKVAVPKGKNRESSYKQGEMTPFIGAKEPQLPMYMAICRG